jgi:phosphomannomutase
VASSAIRSTRRSSRRFSAALARSLPADGPVVIGRDARVTGPMVRLAAAAGINAAGRDVVDIGLATTPTTQLAVEHLKAAGGVILTASHNPAPWNALKFLSARGEFLARARGARCASGSRTTATSGPGGTGSGPCARRRTRSNGTWSACCR